MQFVNCRVCGRPVVGDVLEDLYAVHKICDWPFLAKHVLSSRSTQRRESEWGGRSRDCPKCSFNFTSVQDLGHCPNCKHPFYASQPNASRPPVDFDESRPLPRESEVSAHLECLKEQMLELLRVERRLADSDGTSIALKFQVADSEVASIVLKFQVADSEVASIVLKFQGYTNEEIAEQLKCSVSEARASIERIPPHLVTWIELLNGLRAKIDDVIGNWEEFAARLDNG